MTSRAGRASPELPERKRRGRFVLPLAFLLFTGIGSALGLGARPPKAVAAPVAASQGPEARSSEPMDLAPPVDASSAAARSPIARLNPDASVARAWLLAEGPEPVAADGRRYVTFTFDDGPFIETTPAILRVLGQRKIRASFFVVGQYLEGTDRRAERVRNVVRDMVRAGHLVGNHTQNHKLLTSIARSDAVAQIDEGSDAIERTLGKRPILFRPPFGELDPFTRDILRARGLELVLWSVEAADMRNDDPEAMAKSLESQLDYNGGGIVLLHDIRPTTLPTLKRLLELIHRKRWNPKKPERVGFQIVDLPAYFALTEASPRPYANREALENARRDRHPSAHPPARARSTRESKPGAELVL